MKRLAWLLALVGCVPTIPGDPRAETCISPLFSPESIADIVSAAHEWRDATGGGVDLDLRVDGNTTCELEIRPVYMQGACGRTLGDASAIWLNPDPICSFRRSALHEIGHFVAWGEDHSPNETDVMFPEQRIGIEHLSPNDIARFPWPLPRNALATLDLVSEEVAS